MARVSRGGGAASVRGGSLQVRVYVGQDPVTRRDRYLSETIKGTDRAARRKAEKTLTRLQAEADRNHMPDTSVPLRQALAEWLRTAELEDTTRRTYAGYIERTIHPAIGDVAIDRLNARTLETLYGELRRCRVRCDGRPSIEHGVDGEHDCAKAKCRPHTCRPMSASTVRQIHSIISATLSAAVRWELLTAGVDLRTVAGRLGHGGGGATTLKVYAAWVAASDRKAAELLRTRPPARRPKAQ